MTEYINMIFFIQRVLALSDDDPLKMEEIRRFSAIYGRFDCKRKPEKPLTLHEVSFFDTFSKKFTVEMLLHILM